MKKTIHQMWFQGLSHRPSMYESNCETWRNIHPDYRYEFWDEHRVKMLIKDSYPAYFERWQSLDKIIKKCDSARLFILHKYGGIYADLDTIPYRPMGDLISDLDLDGFDIVLSEESHDVFSWKAALSQKVAKSRNLEVVVGNAIMMSAPDCEFWIQFLDRAFAVHDQDVLETFSSWHLSRFLQTIDSKESVAVIPGKFLLGTKFLGPDTYATHAYDATWFDHSKPEPWVG